MLFDRDETLRLRRLIEAESAAFNAEDLRFLIDQAKRWKPPGYDAHIAGVRKRYLGHQKDILEAALRVRFPKTADRMPLAPLNLMRFIASQDAGAYKAEPERTIVVDGQELDDGDERVKRYHEQLRRARLATVMPEIERRAMAARGQLARVTWSTAKKRLVVRMYWPDLVDVIPHPSAPDELDLSVAVIARVVSPDGVQSDDEWYQVWTRGHEDEPDGTPKNFDRWHVRLMSLQGNASAVAAEPYAGNLLPWAIYRVGEAEGMPWVDEDRDLVDVVDAFNVSRSNEMYTLDLQGHTQNVYAGNQMEVSELAIGPDEVLKIGAAESMTALDYNPKLEDMRESRKLALRELATSRRNSPHAYVAEPNAAESGFARMVANIPHDEAVDELIEYARDFEAQLLPILVDVHDTFAEGEPDIGIPGAVYEVRHRRRPQPEDPEAKQRRVLEAMQEGGITPARGWTELGYYRDTADAITVLGEQAGEIQGRGSAPAGQRSTLSEQLRARFGGQPAETDGEDEREEA